ncbi:MAG: methylenetetrahydrofolate reductase, partial [Rhodospirillales bacterium]|nr:methylenetetrahydrofolate reductase [Rhodospirillales bacterium]
PPPAGVPDAVLRDATMFRGQVDAVNVTDGAGARSHMSCLAVSALLIAQGVEPVIQFTCRDRNRIALQGDLLGAAALGVRNVLFMTGDDPKAGDQPETKPVFDLNSGQLISMTRAMRDQSELPSGRKIEGAPNLFLGAADTPMDPAPNWAPDGLTAKADAGAQFVQTQFCFDMDILTRYMARLVDAGITERLSFIMGMGPMASAKSARWMRDNLWGVIIPDHLIERLERAEDQKAEGHKICVELIQQLAEIEGVAGTHVMAIRQEAAIPGILASAGVGPAHRV